MSGLRFSQVVLSLRVTVADADLERHVVAAPTALGEALAREVHAYAAAQRLGYYPALDFFRDQGGIDPQLLGYAEEVARLATRLVREEVQRTLRPVFASLRFDTLQALAFSMPPVRPAQLNALALLARHYTPNQVRADLGVTLLQKGAPAEGLERYAQQVVARWLKPAFADLALTGARAITP